jgi:hypothetical protein
MADGKYLIGESLREKLKSTIAKVESIPFGGPVSRIPTVIEGGDGRSFAPKVFRVCTAAGAWPFGSSKTVTYYGTTSTPNTVSVVNGIVSLPAPRIASATRLVNIAKDGTQWYLISFQLSTMTAVLATATRQITFLGTNATQQITFLSGDATQTITYSKAVTSEVTVVTGVSATFNTTDCTIAVDAQTATIRMAGEAETAAMILASGTQTAATILASGTQTASISTGTITATLVSLEI